MLKILIMTAIMLVTTFSVVKAAPVFQKFEQDGIQLNLNLPLDVELIAEKTADGATIFNDSSGGNGWTSQQIYIRSFDKTDGHEGLKRYLQFRLMELGQSCRDAEAYPVLDNNAKRGSQIIFVYNCPQDRQVRFFQMISRDGKAFLVHRIFENAIDWKKVLITNIASVNGARLCAPGECSRGKEENHAQCEYLGQAFIQVEEGLRAKGVRTTNIEFAGEMAGTFAENVATDLLEDGEWTKRAYFRKIGMSEQHYGENLQAGIKLLKEMRDALQKKGLPVSQYSVGLNPACIPIVKR